MPKKLKDEMIRKALEEDLKEKKAKAAKRKKSLE